MTSILLTLLAVWYLLGLRRYYRKGRWYAGAGVVASFLLAVFWPIVWLINFVTDF